MKKFLSLITIVCLLCGVLLTTSCGEPKAPAGTVTRVTIDMNPSIELLIDEQGKVISAVGLNDDGALIVAGEAFEGKTAVEALELALTVASETGYLVKGNAENALKLSVSGEGEYAESLADKLEGRAKKLFRSLKISGTVEVVEALKTETLRAFVANASLYTEEELSDKTDKELYHLLAEGRTETALVLTDDMRETFLSEKTNKINLARKKAIADIIEELGEAQLVTLAAYEAAIEAYSDAIDALESLRYETLLAPDSAYQTSLTALREAKTELLKKRTYTASLEVGDSKYAEAKISLALSETAYETALAAYEALGSSANEAIDLLVAAVRSAEEALRELEGTIFSADLKKELSERTLEIEAALFSARAEFFADFEEAHGDDVRAVKEALIKQKAELKEAISSNK